MSNPLQHIDEAKATIARRQKQREGTALEHRGSIAAEAIADELTLLRAEATLIRLLLAEWAALS